MSLAGKMSSKDLKAAYIATFEAREKWANLLLALDMPNATIEAIRAKFQGNPDDCLRQGLSQWLQEEERSWNDLAEAMSSPIVGHKEIGRSISRLHHTGEQNSEFL